MYMIVNNVNAQESLLSKSHRLSKWKNGERFEFQYEMVLPSTADTIFPLLCPILEYDWLNGWKCTMIYSESGVAENNCIFYNSTGFPLYKRKTFQVIEYVPNSKIAFLIFINKVGSIRFSLSLNPLDEKNTIMKCYYIMSGYSKFGNRQLKNFKEKVIEKQVKNLE